MVDGAALIQPTSDKDYRLTAAHPPLVFRALRLYGCQTAAALRSTGCHTLRV